MSRLAAVILILSLAACGMKGPLVLPPGPVPEPLLGKPKPAAKDANTLPVPTKPSGTAATNSNP